MNESNPQPNLPSDDSQAGKRPLAITIICILGFIGALFAVPLIFSSLARSIGTWYPPFLALGSAVGLTCMIGLWMMRKWAVYAYTAFVAINQIVLLTMGVWNVFALLIPAIVIAIGFTYLSKMK